MYASSRRSLLSVLCLPMLLIAAAAPLLADEPAAAPPRPAPTSGEKVAIRGTHIRLARPAGFAISAGNPGFVNEETGERDVRTPRFTVAPSDRPIEIEDRKQLAEQLALRAFNAKNGKLESIAPIHIDDLDGFATQAVIEKEEPGVPLYVYQAVLLVGADKEQTFWILRGESGVESRQEFAADFKKMASSFRRQK